MKIKVLGCSGGQLPGYKLSSFLVNDSLLIDAGSTTAVLSLKGQQKIRDILITHIHLDHAMALATIADNLYSKRVTPINVWGISEVIAGLKKSFFNDRIWPDFTRIKGDTQPAPVLRLRTLMENRPAVVGDCRVTTVRVNHSVPSTAFFIENKKKTLLHIGDTGPTKKVWAAARKNKNLCAIVIETSFPDRLQEIADVSCHLTPQALAREIDKLGRPSVPILITHLKPEYRNEIIASLKRIKGYHLRILKDGDLLQF
ncbi:MAG TPA: 3',5'-cyclic-nucleotide phosphodiesterase [Candidatus Binatia bacterium]|jgi:cAMP phosphodiesterase|nr:3',5'-cyclic-nucleotide phosphodiesterase [Candidatus Binatia bacterium]